MLGIAAWMVTPFPIHPFVKTPQLCSLWSNLGAGFSTAFVSSMSSTAYATCWSMTLLHFDLGFLPVNTLAWADQSNKNLGHNWAKILWEKMGMEAGRFPNKWCDVHSFDPAADLHQCGIRMKLLASFNVYISKLFVLSTVRKEFFLPTAQSKDNKNSLLYERRGTKIPASLYKDLRKNNSGDCCRSRLGQKQITP